MMRIPVLRHMAALVAMASVGLLSGCLDVPHPFRDPGREGRSLAGSPPPARLAVPVPLSALL
ncbi:hypothetical protein HUK84_22500, partial [Nguyenibacter vanlangensis]|nr:hypothetical protein [Nguyenibacter vanlangensis]